MSDWRLITDDGVSASFGLAADEYMARAASVRDFKPVLRLYTYRSYCALVGRFQNVDHEVHRDYCAAHGITVNRRPTGGGAIIMGADQLGIALCIPGRVEEGYSHARELMARFSEGVVNGMQTLGVDASFRRKNDVEVKGRKLAGLGIYRAPGGGLLLHASLLVDLDLPLMLRVLQTPFEKISDKEIATVADRITTVRRELGRTIMVDEVRTQVAGGYAAAFGVRLAPDTFTLAENDAIAILERGTYLSPGWLAETTTVADAAGTAKVKTPDGLLDVSVTLAGSILKAIFIRGDFFTSEHVITELEAALRWHSAEPESVAATLARMYAAQGAESMPVPLEALAQAIQQAVRRARLAESVTRADPYGCFVNPQSATAAVVTAEGTTHD